MKTRFLAAVALSVAAASSAIAQQPVKKPQAAVLKTAPFVVVRSMPDVLWLDATTARMQIIKALDRSPQITGEGIVLVQEPPPGIFNAKQITLTLGRPKTVLTASSDHPRVNESVIFSVVLDPPPPARINDIQYHLVFDNEDVVVPAQTTRQFAEAKTYEVLAYAVIGSALTTDRTPITITAVAPPAPPPPPAPKLTLSASTMNPKANEPVTFKVALDPQPLNGSTYVFAWGDGTPDLTTIGAEATHRFASTGNYTVNANAVIDGTRVVSDPLVLSVIAPPPPPKKNVPPPIPWLWIAVALIALAAASSLVRRRPASPEPVPTVPISVRSGLRPSKVTIEKPEHVRLGFTVRLRAGFRSEEGGTNA